MSVESFVKCPSILLATNMLCFAAVIHVYRSS